MSLSDRKPHPLVKPLCERLRRWRTESGLKTPPHLERDLQDALEVSESAQVEPELVIFLVAICEWWFRVYRPSEEVLRRVLRNQLRSSSYTPYPSSPAHLTPLPHVLPVVHRYVDKHLSQFWEPQGSPEQNNFSRMTLQNRINELVRQLAHPFLVLTYLALPAKQGGYSEWGPWVAAISIHSFALTKRVGLQDRRPLEAASAILKALRENEPDNSFFYRKRREIECLAPDLIKVLLSAYEKAERMVVQDDKIEPFIDEDCFPSLMQTGGWSLLVGK